jgi:hypothetical protein
MSKRTSRLLGDAFNPKMTSVDMSSCFRCLHANALNAVSGLLPGALALNFSGQSPAWSPRAPLPFAQCDASGTLDA